MTTVGTNTEVGCLDLTVETKGRLQILLRLFPCDIEIPTCNLLRGSIYTVCVVLI